MVAHEERRLLRVERRQPAQPRDAAAVVERRDEDGARRLPDAREAFGGVAHRLRRRRHKVGDVVLALRRRAPRELGLLEEVGERHLALEQRAVARRLQRGHARVAEAAREAAALVDARQDLVLGRREELHGERERLQRLGVLVDRRRARAQLGEAEVEAAQRQRRPQLQHLRRLRRQPRQRREQLRRRRQPRVARPRRHPERLAGGQRDDRRLQRAVRRVAERRRKRLERVEQRRQLRRPRAVDGGRRVDQREALERRRRRLARRDAQREHAAKRLAEQVRRRAVGQRLDRLDHDVGEAVERRAVRRRHAQRAQLKVGGEPLGLLAPGVARHFDAGQVDQDGFLRLGVASLLEVRRCVRTGDDRLDARNSVGLNVLGNRGARRGRALRPNPARCGRRSAPSAANANCIWSPWTLPLPGAAVNVPCSSMAKAAGKVRKLDATRQW